MIESTATTAINHEDFTSVFNALIEHLFYEIEVGERDQNYQMKR